MQLTVFDALTLLSQIAQTAQTSGLVPGGTPALALVGLATALQATLQSGVLTPSTPIELNDIGSAFEAAVEHQRQVLADTPRA